jgi:ribose-phosphate pyrophosphokinase
VVPFYGYARPDRKAQGREPITARLLADLLYAAGAERLVGIDLHSGQIQGFFEGPVDHLTAAPVLINYLRENIPSGSVIVPPDTGRVKVAERYAKRLDCEVAAIYKRRSLQVANEVEALGVMGDVDGRTCVIIDDMIDTAGTICAAVDTLFDNGATDVLCATTHAVFSGLAVERLRDSRLSKVIVTNSVPLPDSKQFEKLEILSVAEVLADALEAVFEDASVSEIFDGDNHS